MSRITTYTQTWMERCYSDGIPDQVSDKLMLSGRVPSYKAIALSILKNDNCQSIGFTGNVSSWYYILKDIENEQNCEQWQLPL